MNEEVKVRAKVLLVRDDRTYAICKGCDSELEVPLVFDMNFAKSMVNAVGPRLYLKK